MRPGAAEARMQRQLRREQQAMIISDLMTLACIIGLALGLAVYLGLFE